MASQSTTATQNLELPGNWVDHRFQNGQAKALRLEWLSCD